MSTFHWLQFILFSLGVYFFNVFTQVIHYSDFLLSSLEDHSKYDFIIVGAGTAGSLIAHRLATETNYTFVVLEAGSNSNFLLEIPVLGPLLHGSVFDWNYATVPQENACIARKDQKCRLPQGKIVGGSSKLNNMVYVRGNISHYVNWFHGKYGEKYIESQFDFIENNILELDHVQYTSELADAILKAADEIRTITPGINSFSKSTLMQRNGKRWTLSDHLDKSYVKSNVLVEKIFFTVNTATGVSVLHSKQRKSIYAEKGVILSAGTYNTPKILQLSGIGPKEILEPLNIAIRKNLPVGKNLQDHITAGLDLVMFNSTLSVNGMSIVNPLNILNYLVKGKGPLTSPGCEVVGFLSTNKNAESDLQFMVLPVGISSDRGAYLKEALGIKDSVWQNYFSKNFDKHTVTILPIVLHPKSMGEIYINSSDPSVPVLINHKYLSHPYDIEKLVQGLKLLEQFVNTNAMKTLGAYLNPTVFPGCEEFIIFSEKYWQCYVRQLTLTSYHPIGTCSMGLPYSKSTVVDTSFKVLGFKNLYVADGSVLPTLPSGNINAAIAMMANIFFDTNIASKKINFHQNDKHVCEKSDEWNLWITTQCLVIK